MNFDKAYIIGIPKLTPSRIKKCFDKFKEQNISVELWEGINGLEVDIEKYKKSGYLSKDFKLKMPGSLGCLLSHVTLWEKIFEDQNKSILMITHKQDTLKFCNKIFKIESGKLFEVNKEML